MANPQNSIGNNDLQGEGNYDAARRYDKAQRDFVESGQVDDAARKAAPKNAEEEKALQRAEQEGKSHAKDEDPAVSRGKAQR